MPKDKSAAGQKAWEAMNAGKLEEEKRKRDAQAMQLARERERAAAPSDKQGGLGGAMPPRVIQVVSLLLVGPFYD